MENRNESGCFIRICAKRMENHTKKAAFAQSLSTEDSGRKSIPADIHPQYIPQRTNHRISANTNPQPIRQLTLDTQKAPRRVNPAGCFSVHCFSFQKAYFVAYWMKMYSAPS